MFVWLFALDLIWLLFWIKKLKGQVLTTGNPAASRDQCPGLLDPSPGLRTRGRLEGNTYSYSFKGKAALFHPQEAAIWHKEWKQHPHSKVTLPLGTSPACSDATVLQRHEAQCPPVPLLSQPNDSLITDSDLVDMRWALTFCTSNKLPGLCCWSLDDKATDHLGQGPGNFSSKGQTVNTLGFGNHMVSITTTQLCSCSQKTATENM